MVKGQMDYNVDKVELELCFPLSPEYLLDILYTLKYTKHSKKVF